MTLSWQWAQECHDVPREHISRLILITAHRPIDYYRIRLAEHNITKNAGTHRKNVHQFSFFPLIFRRTFKVYKRTAMIARNMHISITWIYYVSKQQMMAFSGTVIPIHACVCTHEAQIICLLLLFVVETLRTSFLLIILETIKKMFMSCVPVINTVARISRQFAFTKKYTWTFPACIICVSVYNLPNGNRMTPLCINTLSTMYLIL